MDEFSLLEEVTAAFGVRMRCYGEDLAGLDDFDDGLRSQILQNHNAAALREFLKSMEHGVAHICADSYDCRYCLFRLPPPPPASGGERAFYCVIGPWREIPPDDSSLSAIISRDNIPRHLHSELARYLTWVPCVGVHSWETSLLALVSNLYGEKARLQFADRESFMFHSNAAYSPESGGALSTRRIEERHRNENALLEAVSRGDVKKAFQHMARFDKQYERIIPGQLGNMKMYMLTLNALLRKAVENGYVHPAHIDATSGDFIRRVESSASQGELTRVVEMMIRRYCDLVKRFSLRGFSPLVRNVINTVDFNFYEQLSLSSLAKQFNANPSNLSSRFKREKGMSLIDYINSKRFEHAASLLYASGLYIEEIAERCGFLDVSYFNRLFKRRFGMSPGEYRKRVGHVHAPWNQ
jgi:AraC-like DNA-binding protein